MRVPVMILELPFPPPHCWPNARSRSHWPKTRAKALAKKWAQIACLKCRKDYPTGVRFTIQITCFPKANGPDPDGDNINASGKAYFDGIADAMGVNDRNFTVLQPIIETARTSTFRIEVLAS